MTNYIKPAVTLTHEDTVKVVTFFDKAAKRLERKLSERGKVITAAREAECERAADAMVKAQFGFHMRDMFATVA